jgi:hypothetical protein
LQTVDKHFFPFFLHIFKFEKCSKKKLPKVHVQHVTTLITQTTCGFCRFNHAGCHYREESKSRNPGTDSWRERERKRETENDCGPELSLSSHFISVVAAPSVEEEEEELTLLKMFSNHAITLLLPCMKRRQQVKRNRF